jgi:hypothetical protein
VTHELAARLCRRAMVALEDATLEPLAVVRVHDDPELRRASV